MTRAEFLQHLKSNEPYFIITSMKNTDERRWGCNDLRKSIGEKVRAVKLHEAVDEAIQIELSDGNQWYMHYNDLTIFDTSIMDSKNESFLFEIENLIV